VKYESKENIKKVLKMNLQQISENLVFLIFSVLLSSLAMACLNQLKPKDPDEASRLEINGLGHDKSKNCQSGNKRFHKK
jgi:hypothetical protein